MKLKVERKHLEKEYTIGEMYIDFEDGSGWTYFCDTLEDTVRDLDNEKKIFGKTAIPYGKYYIELSYSPKYKKIMPKILNVPHFEGILIHTGNTKEDTNGCILIGTNNEKGKVNQSILTFGKLMIYFANNKQEKYSIEIV